MALSAAIMLQRQPVSGDRLHDLVVSDHGGASAYMSTGLDPQMILCEFNTQEVLKLGAGCYRFYFQARITYGRMMRPRLYVDCGSGFVEKSAANAFLQPVGKDTWIGEIIADRPINKIRFDPSEAIVKFTLLRMDIEEWGQDRPSFFESLRNLVRAACGALPEVLLRRRVVQRVAAFVSDLFFAKQRVQAYDRSQPLTENYQAVDTRPVAAAIAAGSDLYRDQYAEYVNVANGGRDPDFAPMRVAPASVAKGDPQVIAFYLPQFHPFPENDAWWGRGFTEWTNVSKAVPQFKGHYQPRLPGELGFYDLRLKDIMARQIELAKHFGVSGFCFHYYWFNGKRLLERPIENLLAEKGREYDFPFCLCWANENWTRRWDGAEHDVLMQQSHTPDDHANVFADLLRYMKDPRYIRVDGKPVVLVYRPAIIPEVMQMVEIWRAAAKEAGLPGIYLVATTAFGFSDPAGVGFDALCQFPPHAVAVGGLNGEVDFLNPQFQGNIYDYRETVDAYCEILNGIAEAPHRNAFFPGVMTSWDNEARKPGRGHIFHGATPAIFNEWVSKTLAWSSKYNSPSEQIVFVNAWNEWAEGTYLEPDRRYGYAYLNAVSTARYERLVPANELFKLAEQLTSQSRKADTALCLHLFYEDLIEEFAEAIEIARADGALDVLLSVPDTWSVATLEQAIARIQPLRVVVSKNRGRDVWPFIQTLRLARDLGFTYGIKFHSKKSLHLSDGERWRRGLWSGLMSGEARRKVQGFFAEGSDVGLAAPVEAFYSASDADAMRYNQTNVAKVLARIGVEAGRIEDFVAGTMFWFRVDAFDRLALSSVDEHDFGCELGAIDGTIAHAFERVFPTLVVAAGKKIARYSAPEAASSY